MNNYEKCKNDICYFANFIHVEKDRNIVNIELTESQKSILKHYQNSDNLNELLLSTRVNGATTACITYLVWYSIFNENKHINIVSCNLSYSEEVLINIKIILKNLPSELIDGSVKYNKTKIVLGNGTVIECKSKIDTGVDFIYLCEGKSTSIKNIIYDFDNHSNVNVLIDNSIMDNLKYTYDIIFFSTINMCYLIKDQFIIDDKKGIF